MADSDALRARRRRRHSGGDHSLCIPGRCKALEAPVVDDVPPSKLGEWLWEKLTADGDLPPVQHVLAIQTCRMIDRLETFDRQLQGHDWLRFRTSDDQTEVTVYVDRLVSEERETATALKGLLAELEKGLPKPKQEPKGGGKLASVVALLEAKRPAPDRGPATG
jgi:hypothetical protein